MATTYEIPLSPQPQAFSVTFPSGISYSMRLIYQFNDDDCWLLDIGDVNGNPLVCGIPLVTGVDLLAQYGHFSFGAMLFVTTDGDIGEPPHWWNLGQTAHLWVEG